MSKKRKPRPFLGYEIGRSDISPIASLCLLLGLTKRSVKTESDMWAVSEKVFGLRREEGEPFMVAVRRVRNKIAALPADERKAAKDRHGIVSPKPAKKAAKQFAYVPQKAKDDFYKSWEWRKLRMEVIKQHGRRCMCCGATPGDETISGAKARIVVDHIKPLSKFWHLRLERTNLQILCDECNQGKGAWDETDWRDEPPTDPLTAEYRAIMGAPEALQ